MTCLFVSLERVNVVERDLERLSIKRLLDFFVARPQQLDGLGYRRQRGMLHAVTGRRRLFNETHDAEGQVEPDRRDEDGWIDACDLPLGQS